MKFDWSQAYSFLSQGETYSKPLVGISACLCGDRVRYDGRDKGMPGLVETLEKKLTLVKVCPEVAIGMSVPRAPIQLVQIKQGKELKIEARGIENPRQNVTEALGGYAQEIINRYTSTQSSNPILSGFILKNRSPSCGIKSTPIHENGKPITIGNGIFSQQLQQQLPWLPVTGEEALKQASQQQAFIHRCQLVASFWQRYLEHGLRAFHRSAISLIEHLPQKDQLALDQLTNATSPKPQDYLTQLMGSLAMLNADNNGT
ncbi:Uncharacterized conserved protein / Hypothetical protein YbgA [gamma proteobacterium IMCC2047]|nr:Uncharacterized conserved protein / Hypothetical protein YbgA [gamma proteobacterium IMCC2047]